MRLSSFSAGLALVAAGLLTAAGATAQKPDDQNARRLAQQAHEAASRSDHQQAAERYAKAYELVKDPAYLLGLARAQVGLGKLASGRATYERLLDDKTTQPPPSTKMLDDASREMQALVPHLSWLTIELAGAEDAKVTLDDVEIARRTLGEMQAIDPGKHVVRLRGEGLTADETFIVSPGEERVVKLSLHRSGAAAAPMEAPVDAPAPAPLPPPPSGTQRTVGIVSLIVGGAGVATGAVFGALAMSARSDLEAGCLSGVCGPAYHGTIDQYRTFGAVSTIGFAAGAVGVGLGVVLLATAPSKPGPGSDSAKVSAYVGPGTAGAVGSF